MGCHCSFHFSPRRRRCQRFPTFLLSTVFGETLSIGIRNLKRGCQRSRCQSGSNQLCSCSLVSCLVAFVACTKNAQAPYSTCVTRATEREYQQYYMQQPPKENHPHGTKGAFLIVDFPSSVVQPTSSDSCLFAVIWLPGRSSSCWQTSRACSEDITCQKVNITLLVGSCLQTFVMLHNSKPSSPFIT